MSGANLFNSIKLAKNKKNVFDLSHDVKLSMDMGLLVPTMCMPVIPGDKFKLGCEMFVRYMPMLAPVMHRFDVSAHYFFVPNRILWPGWELFMRNGNDSGTGVPAHPFFTIESSNYTPLCDYLGIPPMQGITGGNSDQTASRNINALPFAGYQMIWSEFFRDQNVDPNTVFVPLSNGDNTSGFGTYSGLRPRAWEHDYFTSALSFAQRGPAVNLPTIFEDVQVRSNINVAGQPFDVIGSSGNVTVPQGTPTSTFLGDPLYAQTSLLTSTTTINDLRRAIKLQEWFERMALGGARYAEQLYSFFNVRNQDARLQRPEYIVGIKNPVSISEVLNTTGTTDAPQGTMAGHGMSITAGKYGNYYAPEHGYIFCIMSVMPKTCYQQGIPKHFLKINDFTEHFWPQFAHIGEQPVLNDELYGFTATGGGTFGYTPRYAEYKYENNRVCGQFRTSLNYWHAGRIFTSQPALNQGFIESDPTKRIFAVTDPTENSLICHVLHKVQAIRQMPKFGTPSF